MFDFVLEKKKPSIIIADNILENNETNLENKKGNLLENKTDSLMMNSLNIININETYNENSVNKDIDDINHKNINQNYKKKKNPNNPENNTNINSNNNCFEGEIQKNIKPGSLTVKSITTPIINNSNKNSSNENVNHPYKKLTNSDKNIHESLNDNDSNSRLSQNEISNRFEKFVTSGNNNINSINNNSNSTDHQKIANIKNYNVNGSSNLNLKTKVFQYENFVKTTPSNNNNQEHKNINKYLNVSNNINKGVLCTDFRENLDYSNLEDNSNRNLKTCSNINTNMKKIDLEVINNCMKNFLDVEKNLNLQISNEKIFSKTPINHISNNNLEKEILTIDGSQTTKNSNFINIKKKEISSANKTENNSGLNRNTKIVMDNKKPKIPPATKNINHKKFEFDELQFNINYQFDLYNQQEDLKNVKRKNSANSINENRSPDRMSYSDNDYLANIEQDNFEHQVSTPNSNLRNKNIEELDYNISNKKGYSLQESNYKII